MAASKEELIEKLYECVVEMEDEDVVDVCNEYIVLRPHLDASDSMGDSKKVVIGVVEGDTHDIGKNLVKIMLETAGFEMYDLGRDVPLDSFVEKALEVDADIVAMSTLMTTTMSGMGTVCEKLKEAGFRDRVKANAVEAVAVAKELVGLE